MLGVTAWLIQTWLTVIEQISYLLFIKRLDDEELAKEKRANRLGQLQFDFAAEAVSFAA